MYMKWGNKPNIIRNAHLLHHFLWGALAANTRHSNVHIHGLTTFSIYKTIMLLLYFSYLAFWNVIHNEVHTSSLWCGSKVYASQWRAYCLCSFDCHGSIMRQFYRLQYSGQCRHCMFSYKYSGEHLGRPSMKWPEVQMAKQCFHCGCWLRFWNPVAIGLGSGTLLVLAWVLEHCGCSYCVLEIHAGSRLTSM